MYIYGLHGQTAAKPEQGQREKSRLLPMEGLRGVAVAMVFFFHYARLHESTLSGLTKAVVMPLLPLANMGVDIFFVISGYLIYGALLKNPRPFGAFLMRRVQRLYPTFLAVFILYIGLSFVAPDESKLPDGLWAKSAYLAENLLLMPGIFPGHPMIRVAWSLSYEMFFYLTIPLLMAGLRMRAWSPAARLAAFAAFVVLADAFQIHYLRIAMFVCGMILVETVPWIGRRAARPALDALALLSVPLCGWILFAGPPDSVQLTPVQFAAVFTTSFLLCAAAFAGNGPIASALSAGPLRRFGNMSYSYYLLHGLILKLFFVGLARLHIVHAVDGVMFWLLLPAAFILTAAGSAVLFLTIERPCSIMPPAGQAPRPVKTLRHVLEQMKKPFETEGPCKAAA